MKPYTRKSLESYIRILSFFERELKQYDESYNNDFYQINYIVSREQFSNDADIKIILTILKKPFWNNLFNEPFNLKKTLRNYAAYFSITDVTIVRPLSLTIRSNKVKQLLVEIPKLEDRVSFEFFRDNSVWRRI